MNCTATKIWTHWILTKTRQIWGILSNLAQIRSKSSIFRPVRPWNVTAGWHRKTIGNLFHAPISYVCHIIAIREFGLPGIREYSDQSHMVTFSPCVTLDFDRWHWKTIGHLFYAAPSFVHHFAAIGEFKLELRSGNAQIGAKFILTSVTLIFDHDLYINIISVNDNNCWFF